MQHLAPPSKITINSIMRTPSPLPDPNRLAFTVHSAARRLDSTPNSVSAPVPSTNNFATGGVTKSRTDWQSYCAILASKVALQQENCTENITVVNNHTTLDLLPIDKILKPLTVSDLPPAPNHGSTLRVAYEPVPGAYSELAAGKAFPECEAIPCDESEIAFQYVEDRIADRAVLPVENSVTGSIHRNYDLLLRHRLHIVGELQLPFRNDSGNITRFIKLAREPIVPRTDRLFKTSIVFAQEGGTSVLFKVLSAFEFREIKLTKIECRPNRNRPIRVVEDVNGGTAKHFEYMFYVDFEASMAEVRAQNAVAEVEEFTSFLRVLGSYPMDVTPWSPSRED